MNERNQYLQSLPTKLSQLESDRKALRDEYKSIHDKMLGEASIDTLKKSEVLYEIILKDGSIGMRLKAIGLLSVFLAIDAMTVISKVFLTAKTYDYSEEEDISEFNNDMRKNINNLDFESFILEYSSSERFGQLPMPLHLLVKSTTRIEKLLIINKLMDSNSWGEVFSYRRSVFGSSDIKFEINTNSRASSRTPQNGHS